MPRQALSDEFYEGRTPASRRHGQASISCNGSFRRGVTAGRDRRRLVAPLVQYQPDGRKGTLYPSAGTGMRWRLLPFCSTRVLPLSMWSARSSVTRPPGSQAVFGLSRSDASRWASRRLLAMAHFDAASSEDEINALQYLNCTGSGCTPGTRIKASDDARA